MEIGLANEEEMPSPHVLVFPFPGQGHVNSMFKLAQLLSMSGLRVTFLNFDYNHDRLLQNADLHHRFPCLQFRSISDGLSPDHPRTADFLMELLDSMKTHTKHQFKDLLVSSRQQSDDITCIIADGIMISFTTDVAAELRIPIIAFRTISACCFWAYFCIPNLVEAGELPFPDEADMDMGIQSVPGMETFLRRRDLPSFCRARELDAPGIRNVLTETRNTTRASALILNTFEDLESPVLAHIRDYCPITHTLGPLHAHLRSKLEHSLPSDSPPSSFATVNTSLRKEDRSCITWLDAQLPKSVVYVSFGSYTIVTRDELMEFWHGLINSKRRFLWVIRPDLVAGEEKLGQQVPTELAEATMERGCLVDWAPQEEVLNHRAVGGFLTHSGWNSTLESVVAGVPMLCWSFFADQQMNSRFVSDVWRLGLDMKDRCDRETVEMMIVELMEGKKAMQLQESAVCMAGLAARAVGPGGSSVANLTRLIEDIKSMNLHPPLESIKS